MNRLRSCWSAVFLVALLLTPTSPRAGGLTYKGAAEDLTRPEAVAVAPSDKYVYSVTSHESSISVWTRNTGTGLLTLFKEYKLNDTIAQEPEPPGTPTPSASPSLDGMREAKELAVAAASPDGAHVYVAARHPASGGITAFKSAEGDGSLTLIHTYHSDDTVCLGGPNEGVPCAVDSECPSGACNFEIPIRAAHAVALNPEPPAGKHLYVAARASDAIAVFERDATSGKLTLRSAAVADQGTPVVTFMWNPRSLALSPDGLNLYVGAQAIAGGNKDGTVVVFDRDTGTGALTWKQALKYNDPLAPPPLVQRMSQAEDLVVSPDGNFVYVAAGASDAVVVFSRAPDGTLTFVGYQDDGKMHNALGITISPDPAGQYVYATAYDDNAVNVYTRDATTGELLLIDSHVDAEKLVCVGGSQGGETCKDGDDCPGGVCQGQPQLFNAQGVALSIDKKQLYVTARFKGAISVFENDTCGNSKVGADEECDPPGSSCTAECLLDVCAPAPVPCRTPTLPLQASLTIKNNPLKSNSKDEVQWKWKKGAATTAADYGDPTNGTTGANYVLCVYDNTGLLMSRAAPRAGTCAKGKPCWKKSFGGNPSALKKITYQDKLYTPVGISDMKLQPGGAGSAQISVKGKGFFLKPPSLPLTLPVTVQLVNTETPVCWGATFTTTTSDPTDATKLTAKGN